jgi:hypothetical protein
MVLATLNNDHHCHGVSYAWHFKNMYVRKRFRNAGALNLPLQNQSRPPGGREISECEASSYAFSWERWPSTPKVWCSKLNRAGICRGTGDTGSVGAAESEEEIDGDWVASGEASAADEVSPRGLLNCCPCAFLKTSAHGGGGFERTLKHLKVENLTTIRSLRRMTYERYGSPSSASREVASPQCYKCA